MEASTNMGMGTVKKTKQWIIGVWLIRLTYIAMLASSVIDIILGFTDKFDWVDWTSLLIRLAAVAIIVVICEPSLKKNKPVPAVLTTIIVAVIALFFVCVVSPQMTAWLLGIIISLLLSMLVIQLMPPAWMGKGIFIAFIGGAFVALTDFFPKTVNYQINLNDPQSFLLIAMVLGLSVLLFARYSKYPVTAKLLLAISSLVIYGVNILGIIISLVLLQFENSNPETISAISTWYLLGSQIFVMVSAVAALLLARFITNPLLEIVSVADKISQEGDLSQRSITRYHDEVGLMSDSFNQLISSLHDMANIAEEISNGDLTMEVQPKSDRDDLGNAFKKMVSSLRDNVSNVSINAAKLNLSAADLSEASLLARSATDQITSSMQLMASSSQDQTSAVAATSTSVQQMAKAIEGVARGSQEQSQSVSKATEITNQINTAIRQVAQNANAVATDSAVAAEAAKAGSLTVDETLAGMQTIKTKVDAAAEKIGEMGKRSQEIGAIVETIEDIASQTNLLALNAAIEAARAGEHGKGFAIVADEVRKLAERSSLATKEIGALIKGIQTAVSDAVQAMEESSSEVENGVSSAKSAGNALFEILDATTAVNRQAALASEATARIEQASEQLVVAVDAVSAIVEQNTAATEEMAATSTDVSEAIGHIANTSEKNSAEVEMVSASTEEMSAQIAEVTDAAASLSKMAKALDQIVTGFKLTSE